MTDHPTTTTKLLRDLVEQKIDQRWSDFARQHPHLAEAIQRTRLVESTVQSLRTNDDYRAAMEAAGRDEALLAAALRLSQTVEQWIDRALGLN